MPGMPDQMRGSGAAAVGSLDKPAVDIKSLEKRILSSSEHLNEIMTLNSFVQVSHPSLNMHLLT